MVIAAVVQFTKMFIEKTSPLLYRVLGVFLPLITTNCAVLGVALQNAANHLALLMHPFMALVLEQDFLWC